MKWTVEQLDQGFVNGALVSTTAHWRCTHTADGQSGTVYSTASVAGLTDLTLQGVLDHIWANGVDKGGCEAAVMAQIEAAKNAAQVIRLEGMVTAPVPKTPLDEAKAKAYADVDAHHAMVVQGLVGNPTQQEKDTWSMKLETAKAVIARVSPGVVGQAFLATAGIEDKELWAKSVLAKAAGYAKVIGVGERLRSAARQGIKDATSSQEVSDALQAAVTAAEDALKSLMA